MVAENHEAGTGLVGTGRKRTGAERLKEGLTMAGIALLVGFAYLVCIALMVLAAFDLILV